MARRLGEAYVQFGQRGMDRVTASSKRSVGALRAVHVGAVRAAGAVRAIGAAAGIGGLLAVAGAAAMLKKQMTDLDVIAKLAGRTEIGSATIVGLGIAAEEGGSSVQVMNKSLEIFNQRIGEAKDRTGTTRQAFEGLGLSVEALGQMSTEDALRAVSDALQTIPDAATRADKAATLFGRGGRELANILADGSDKIDQWSEKAKELGLDFSADDLKAIEEANDAINSMSRAFQGLFAELAIMLAPAMKSFAESMTEGIRWLREFGSEITRVRDQTIDFLETLGAGAALELLPNLATGRGKGQRALRDLGDKKPPVIDELSDLPRAIKQAVTAQSGSASTIFKTTQAAILRKEDELLAQAKQTNEILKKIEQKPPVNVPPAVLGP